MYRVSRGRPGLGMQRWCFFQIRAAIAGGESCLMSTNVTWEILLTEPARKVRELVWKGACSIKVDCDWLSRLSHKQSFIHCFSTARKVDEVSDKLVKTVEHLAKMDIFLCCVKHILSVCRSDIRIYLHIVQGSEVWSQVVTGDKCWDAFYCQVWTDRHCLCPLCDC